MINWAEEWPLIQAAARTYNVDPFFVAAIRQTEGGAAGREFGVLSVTAPTYEDQLRTCCVSIRNRITGYVGNLIEIVGDKAALSAAFIRQFGHHWAPPAVANDPQNLNARWVTNATSAYHRYMAAGAPS